MHELAGLFVVEEVVDPEEVDALEECAEAEREDVSDASVIAGDEEVDQPECEQPYSDAHGEEHGCHDLRLFVQHSTCTVVALGKLFVDIHGVGGVER